MTVDPTPRLGDAAERAAKRRAVTAAAQDRIRARARAGARRRNVFGVVVDP